MKDIVVESEWLIPKSRENDWHGLAPACRCGCGHEPCCLLLPRPHANEQAEAVGTQAAVQQGPRTSARRDSSQAPGQTTSTR